MIRGCKEHCSTDSSKVMRVSVEEEEEKEKEQYKLEELQLIKDEDGYVFEVIDVEDIDEVSDNLDDRCLLLENKACELEEEEKADNGNWKEGIFETIVDVIGKNGDEVSDIIENKEEEADEGKWKEFELQEDVIENDGDEVSDITDGSSSLMEENDVIILDNEFRELEEAEEDISVEKELRVHTQHHSLNEELNTQCNSQNEIFLNICSECGQAQPLHGPPPVQTTMDTLCSFM